MLANVGGHVAMFTDESGFILPKSRCAYDSLTVCFHYLFPFLILLIMYYIAHIDMVIFQICLLSHSPFLLQYRAQNLGDKEMRTLSMVKVLMVVLANTLKE